MNDPNTHYLGYLDQKLISPRSLIAHQVKISALNQPEWTETNNHLLVPKAKELEELLTVDFGEELLQMQNPINWDQTVLEEYFTYDFPDGSFVIGTLMRNSPKTTPKLQSASQYLNVNFAPLNSKYQGYTFELKPGCDFDHRLLDYQVQQYSLQRGIRIELELDCFRPAFESIDGKPGNFKKWILDKN